MKLGKHPHLQAEKLLHLLRLLGIRATYKPLCSVGISTAGTCGYFFDGRLGYAKRGEKAMHLNEDLSAEPVEMFNWFVTQVGKGPL